MERLDGADSGKEFAIAIVVDSGSGSGKSGDGMSLGYDKALYLLPFDHRQSYVTDHPAGTA